MSSEPVEGQPAEEQQPIAEQQIAEQPVIEQRTEEQPIALAPAAAPASSTSWWSPLTFGLAAVVVLGIVALFMPNLGAMALAVGIGAFVLAVIGVITLVTSGSRDYGSWGVAVAVLVVVGVLGVLLSSPAYHAGIALAESSGNYAQAVQDEQAIGDKPPYSQDLAQTYLDWAQAEVNEHAFSQAIDHLSYVVAQFPTLPQAEQAQIRRPTAYLAWARFALTQHDDFTAGQAYNTLLTTYAGSSAASQAKQEAAPTLLAWGQQLQQGKFYQDAYNAFLLIDKDFPNASQASQAHQLAAQDDLAWAQALTAAHRYDLAAQRYQDLATNFGDTSQGAQAQKVLNQGVVLIGRLFRKDGHTPVVLHTTVRISSSWAVESNGVYTVAGRQYLADTDSNGYFEFPSVPAGQYLLEWRNTTGIYETFANGTQPSAIVTVLPLEPLVLAPITTDMP
jgi:tetratricopeptide (TPR) repeat protein